jgi:membrane-associated phospholipid phosphatase
LGVDLRLHSARTISVDRGAADSPGISFWFEAIVLVLVAYDAINNLAPVLRAAALSRALSILAFERSLHINIELTLNRWLADHSILGYIDSTYYDLGHFLITFGVFGVLLWKRRDLYPRLRTQLVLMNMIAFVVFWRYPVAPPRMLVGAGFRDIVARTDALVSFHTGRLAHDANQYAAFPSLHVAWAMWSARAILRITHRPLIRVLAVLMPLLTAFTVLATGNHFVLDVLAGAATFALAWLLTAPLHRLASWIRRLVARVASANGLPARARGRAGEPAHVVQRLLPGKGDDLGDGLRVLGGDPHDLLVLRRRAVVSERAVRFDRDPVATARHRDFVNAGPGNPPLR